MLGKLFAQEMRALWKPAAIMLAVMVVAGVVGIGCIEATDAVSRAAGFASRYVNEASAASNLTVVFVMAALFCGFLVWASLVAVYVFIAMRFYRTMFTDEGYLFGPEGSGFERLVLACPRYHLQKALERLDAAAGRRNLPR